MADPADAQRLLTSLVPRETSRRWSRRRQWGAVVGLTGVMLIGALYGVVRSTRDAPHMLLAPKVAVTAPPQLVVTAMATPASAVSHDIQPTPAARIEFDPPMQPALQTPVVAMTASTARTKKAEHHEHQSNRTTSMAAVTASPARRNADSDVDLLEAVVAHVSGRSTGVAKPAAKSVKPVSGRSAASDKPDVVPHTGVDKTADGVGELVQRCQAIGGIEGLLCRNRVCDGHWGSDAACPANRPPAPQLP